MIDVTVKVDGDQEVVAHLGGSTDAVRARLRVALQELGREVSERAASLAPQKSGKLRASLRERLRESGDSLTETIRPSRFYARFQETGLDTMRKPPRQRGIVGVRTRLTKSGTVLVSPRRGLLRRAGGAGTPFHLPAHPFMRPAFESLRARIQERLVAAVAAGVEGG